ncbi:MAG TPA: Crp/Fnr family transcriptional regulator [Vicinamibacterales bacterium]|nr:Crp/Fnr family transcriptional regulator [Vicinamibacterales bacterium]
MARYSVTLSPPAAGNLLLAALPAADYERIVAPLEVVSLPLRQILHRPGQPVRNMYFPASGFCSELMGLRDGRMVEVATIGREGLVGLFAAPVSGGVASIAMVQATIDRCVKMPAARFWKELEARGHFFNLVSRYRFALTRFVMQSTACNAVHTIEERLARWLLTARDHLGASEFPLTQEFAAMMLGAPRSTVSEVAATLQRAGLIAYRRGRVTIADDERLEAAACECYGITAVVLDSLTPQMSRRQPSG